MRFYSLFIFLVCLIFSSKAQITGGQSSFAFLQTPQSAKIAAIGGDNVSSYGNDPSMVYKNPALLNNDMTNRVNVNVTSFKSGTKLSSLHYVVPESKIGIFSVGLTYLNYGVLTRRDESGANQGEFFANDFILHGSKAFKQDNFVIGFTPKIAFSQIERYNAMAFATDIGGTFNHPEKNITVGLTIQNVGFTLKNYSEVNGKLPFNATGGVTVKPEHMPLKMSITAHHLQQFDIVYDDPNQRNQPFFITDSTEYKVPLGNKILRHFTIGGEFILSENFNFRMGYNFQRRRELRLTDKSGGAGFSFGFMIKTKAYQIDFTKVYNNYAGRPIYLSIIIDFNNILKRKQITPSEV